MSQSGTKKGEEKGFFLLSCIIAGLSGEPSYFAFPVASDQRKRGFNCKGGKRRVDELFGQKKRTQYNNEENFRQDKESDYGRGATFLWTFEGGGGMFADFFPSIISGRAPLPFKKASKEFSFLSLLPPSQTAPTSSYAFPDNDTRAAKRKAYIKSPLPPSHFFSSFPA